MVHICTKFALAVWKGTPQILHIVYQFKIHYNPI